MYSSASDKRRETEQDKQDEADHANKAKKLITPLFPVEFSH
jgi:hypothetical protein